MIYDALEIAHFVITNCSLKENPISNLKLQQILYLIWHDFSKETNRSLFENDICAWDIGPVVPDVYYEYCAYAGRPIHMKYNCIIEKDDSILLDLIINKYISCSAADLQKTLCANESPWTIIYDKGKGKRRVIKKELIKKTS